MYMRSLNTLSHAAASFARCALPVTLLGAGFDDTTAVDVYGGYSSLYFSSCSGLFVRVWRALLPYVLICRAPSHGRCSHLHPLPPTRCTRVRLQPLNAAPHGSHVPPLHLDWDGR